MVPSILFLGEVVVVVELIEVDHFSRIFDLSHFRDPPDEVRGVTLPHRGYGWDPCWVILFVVAPDYCASSAEILG